MAKNQLPDSLPEPIVIPGLSQFCGSDSDNRHLYPVRAVRTYLDKVKSKKSGRKRLFLPFKGSKDISPSTVSRWIFEVINLTFSDLSSSDRHSGKEGDLAVLWCWVNFQCPGVLLIWTIVLAVGVDRGCLDIFSHVYHFSSFSLSLARYRQKYCLKGPLNPKQSTNQHS